MRDKRIVCPQRLRRIPAQFSWVDHRLVRERHISKPGPEALALYLLLVCVADARGLSYYSDRAAAELIAMEEDALRRARRNLIDAGLIAYQRPLYQVLSLEAARPPVPDESRRAERCLSFAEILASMRREPGS